MLLNKIGVNRISVDVAAVQTRSITKKRGNGGTCCSPFLPTFAQLATGFLAAPTPVAVSRRTPIGKICVRVRERVEHRQKKGELLADERGQHESSLSRVSTAHHRGYDFPSSVPLHRSDHHWPSCQCRWTPTRQSSQCVRRLHGVSRAKAVGVQ